MFIECSINYSEVFFSLKLFGPYFLKICTSCYNPYFQRKKIKQQSIVIFYSSYKIIHKRYNEHGFS